MAKQSVKYNEAVTMRRFGFSYKKIAELINCSVPWCAAKLSKVKIDEELMIKAYLDFRKEAKSECPVCGGYFNFDEGFNIKNEDDTKILVSACSYPCFLHLLGYTEAQAEELMAEEFTEEYNKLNP